MLRYGLFMALNRWAWWSARVCSELAPRLPYTRRWAKPRKIIWAFEAYMWGFGYWAFRRSIRGLRHVS